MNNKQNEQEVDVCIEQGNTDTTLYSSLIPPFMAKIQKVIGNAFCARENTAIMIHIGFSDEYDEPDISYCVAPKRKETIMARTFNLFISHSWTYQNHYDRLISLLQERPYFSFKDYSVPKDDPIHNAPTKKALYNAIKTQIQPCRVVIVLAGVYSTYSEWIDNEITIATKEFSQKKAILAVAPWGAQRISSTVKENADLIVRWQADSIVDGIRELAG